MTTYDSEVRITLDQDIAKKMKKQNPEQFLTLVRMHLSFQLDLHTDENELTNCEKTKHKKWKGFHKKTKGCTSNKSLSPETAKTTLTKQNIEDLRQLIQFLIQDENIEQEGIFRKTGSVSRQNELKSALVQGIPIKLEKGEYTAHDCASVLKSFLSDLSEPLLTEIYYPAYCQVAEFCNSKESTATEDDKEERLLHTTQLLFLLLPDENRLLLTDIMGMLNKTIKYESTNKMNAENLSTLFTPHLICPRKLAPEIFHTTACQMSNLITFMIKKGSKLFYIPPKLATDIRAYYVEQKRRKTMSPEHILNESITSDSVANTVYTFVDRQKTAEAHEMNSTDTALAQLYAHIQSLPESSKKKKLIKQFNKENGHGTPMMMLRDKSGSAKASGKSFGDSIKRHIFHKNLMSKTPKRTCQTPMSFHESIMTPRSRKPVMFFGTNLGGSSAGEQQNIYASQESLREEDEEDLPISATATITSSQNDLKKMLNDTGLPEAPPLEQLADHLGTLDNGPKFIAGTIEKPSTNTLKTIQEDESNSLTSTFREYLLSRSLMTESPADLSFSSQPDDFYSDKEGMSEDEMSDSLLYCMNNGNQPDPDESSEFRAEIAKLRKRHSEMSDKQMIKKIVLDETSL